MSLIGTEQIVVLTQREYEVLSRRAETWEPELPLLDKRGTYSLPGCMADGATFSEALANAEVVIQEWIETANELGRPIPKAKGRLMFA